MTFERKNTVKVVTTEIVVPETDTQFARRLLDDFIEEEATGHPFSQCPTWVKMNECSKCPMRLKQEVFTPKVKGYEAEHSDCAPIIFKRYLYYLRENMRKDDGV